MSSRSLVVVAARARLVEQWRAACIELHECDQALRDAVVHRKALVARIAALAEEYAATYPERGDVCEY